MIQKDTFPKRHIPQEANVHILERAHSKKDEFQKRHIPKSAHSKRSTFQKNHIPKSAHSRKSTFRKGHIPNRHIPKSPNDFKEAFTDEAKTTPTGMNIVYGELNNPLAINLYVLSYDKNNHLIRPNELILKNLKTYLSKYRILTDGINITNAFVINCTSKLLSRSADKLNPKRMHLNTASHTSTHTLTSLSHSHTLTNQQRDGRGLTGRDTRRRCT